ncbi:MULTISPECIES: polyprenyl synthetase family protein [Enterococcus]|uniref:Polyprenyl synthetase n=1 Tax=Enterococcus sulfureus ATCC 49903 TaxID=1140003 RepID=S0NXQ4_9ENTE|nr:polyprenyl synthetase family protein [Enterococcus sulfureus]EOT46554.1 polyprenyl synthetase [Enterococcus sulfureus ATCC 49903]EOT86134.1 polyprenyl synthetase [Enterococcus sulfureus ATCC 49903]
MKLHPLWADYPTLQKELIETRTLMESSVRLKNKEVEQAILTMIESGGKLLRPAYQLLFSRFGVENDRKKAIAIAASIELLHTATLIHDDIVDEADTRRGVASIRSKFGNSTAVYAGDYLFVSCFKLMSDYASSLKSLQLHSKSMEKILNGELGQMDHRYQYTITIEDYLDTISGKTAELFALSCGIGALESGTSERFAKKASDIGMAIGMAFQIIDDVLDYSQTDQSLGKPVLNDVKQGVYSLPLIISLSEQSPELLALIKKQTSMTIEDQQRIWEIVHETKGVEKAYQYAIDYTQKALKLISSLPDSPQKKELVQLTKTILDRIN